MQITVTIPDELAAQVQSRGLTLEGYVEKLIAEQAGAASPMATETLERLADLELFFAEMAAQSHKVPILPDEALTRESFYREHD